MKTTITDNQVLKCVGENLYRSQSSGIYYAIFRREGKLIKRSLKTTDKELAKRRAAKLRQKVARLNTKEGAAILFQDFAKRWLDAHTITLKPRARARRGQCITALNHFFKGKPVRSITETEVERWATRRAQDRSARTFNMELETLRLIFEYAMRQGLTLENPALAVPRRKLSKPQIVIPSKPQFKRLVEEIRKLNCRAHEAANLCEFLAYSGCRLGEATAITWGDVNFDLKNFTVTGGEGGTKNYEARTVPLFAPLERLLLTLREALPGEPNPTDSIFTIQSAKKALASACREGKLPDFTHHAMRHFFCSNAIEAGADFKVIASWVGHKDGGVLVAKTYGHLRDEHSVAMAKRITFDASQNEEQPGNVIPIAQTS